MQGNTKITMAEQYRSLLWSDGEGSAEKAHKFLRDNLVNTPKLAKIDNWVCRSYIFKDSSVYGSSMYHNLSNSFSTLYFDPDL